jgi:putative peptidoglycan lipid II flippase
MATPARAADSSVVRNSMTVAAWVLVSRVTGFARVAVIGAVLGPTYLGNTFQALNSLPNMIMYNLLLGELFVALLMPSLVRLVDARDRRRVERVAGAFLGMTTVTFLIVAVLIIAGGPLLLRLLTLGVQDQAVAVAQRRVGLLLLVVVMPQVILYGLTATAIAVMNAHRRFVLASAAPALENLGVMATLEAYALHFGTGTSVESVTSAQALLLGLGATAAVGLHAAVQWWGAWRLGIRLFPRAGWRDPEVRELVRRAIPSVGYAWLKTVRLFAALVVANRVAGGVVAFQLAQTFLALAVALGVRAVSTPLRPELARLYVDGKPQQFRDQLFRGMSFVHFLTLPAAVAYFVLAGPLAKAVSFGEMATGAGVVLVAWSLAAQAPSLLGDARFEIALEGSYARRDARSPFYCQALCTAITLAGMVVAFVLPSGVTVLVALGLAISAGSLVAGWDLWRRVVSTLPKNKERGAMPATLRTSAAACLMSAPAYAVAIAVPIWAEWRLANLTGVVAASVVGIIVYAALQRMWRSPELNSLVAELRRTPSRPATEQAAKQEIAIYRSNRS